MAYGNWGAFVYRNGERMRKWEDQTPYHEEDYEAGYHQAFGISKITEAMEAHGKGEDVPASALLDRAKEAGPHHAVLGQKEVRLCGYKSSPVLFVRGEKVDVDQYVTDKYSDDIVEGDETFVYGSEWSGELEGGYTFSASFDTDAMNMIDLELTEPDGTKWTARCGYCYGAGHDDV